MSFSNLRGSSLLYILNKEGVPSVNVGTVINVTAPYGKYGNMAMAFGQQPEQVVDLTVKVDDKQGQFFKVPANADVWEYENNGIKTQYVLATSKDAINAAVNNLRQQAVGIINSVDHNRQVIAACDEMLKQLNPEFAAKQRQEQEIATLKGQMASMASDNAELKNMVAQLLAKLDGDGNKSAKNK